MFGSLRDTLPCRLSICDLEFEIRNMETELDYHREKSRIIEETLHEQQNVLLDIKKEHEHENCIGGNLQ